MKIQIAPSILSADFGKLNEDIATVEDYVDYLHIDVMDGHFVPNLTFGAPVVKCIKSKKPLDVHLMIENPMEYIDDFAKAGANILSFHYEAVENPRVLINMIKERGIKAGMSVKPGTEVEVLEEFLSELDWVLVMSVEPGFGGQSFMPSALDKIKWLREKAPNLDIAVDGGINEETAKLCKEAGANILVAGSYIFKAKDRLKAIESLRG
ncbi:ribulose-phosphate 3-epimerase [bacterium]|nr:ribulose-phosphate 3-epimerase [bacterium]